MRRRAARPIWPLAIAGMMTRRAITAAERDDSNATGGNT
jgi:hypothetical protein